MGAGGSGQPAMQPGGPSMAEAGSRRHGKPCSCNPLYLCKLLLNTRARSKARQRFGKRSRGVMRVPFWSRHRLRSCSSQMTNTIQASVLSLGAVLKNAPIIGRNSGPLCARTSAQDWTLPLHL